MSAPGPERPDRDGDLDAAYARAHALTDEGRGPPAAVRASVLAAAREMAARAQADGGATPPLEAVASPVAAVGRGRSLAVNLSSWRVRAGAAVCAALLVALGAWRFDASRRVDSGAQVAMASLELATPPTRSLPKDLPPAPLAAASTAYVPPPPVVDDPVGRTPSAQAAPSRVAPRDRNLIVAQADQSEQSDRAPRPAPQPDARAQEQRPPAAAEPVAAAPVAPTPEARSAQAPALVRAPMTETLAAAAPPQLTTLPPKPPSVLPRRVVVAPVAAPASVDGDAVAKAVPAARRVEIAGASVRRADAANAAPVSLDAANRPLSASVDSTGARQPSATLQSAADRGDIESLKALLAEPAVRVDAPDAAGRTALLHAVLAQQAAAVRLLIAAGADPARADQAGVTPRAAAQAGANAEIAGLLAAAR